MPQYLKRRPREKGEPRSTKRARLGLVHSIHQATRQQFRAIQAAAAQRNRLENQIKINQLLSEWRNQWRLYQNSAKKRIPPPHVKVQFENLGFHLAELTVLEKAMERASLQHELAEISQESEQKKQLEREMAEIEHTHAQVLEDARLLAKQLQNLWPLPFKKPGEGKNAAKRRKNR